MKTIDANKSIFNKEIIGYREFRNNISNIFDLVTNSFKVVFSGNVKKINDTKTAAIISTTMLNQILSAYKFTTNINYDDKAKQWEVAIDEIGVYSCNTNKEETIKELLDLVVDVAEDYFDNADINARIPEMRKKYPYFLRIIQCQDRDELMKVLNLAD